MAGAAAEGLYAVQSRLWVSLPRPGSYCIGRGQHSCAYPGHLCGRGDGYCRGGCVLQVWQEHWLRVFVQRRAHRLRAVFMRSGYDETSETGEGELERGARNIGPQTALKRLVYRPGLTLDCRIRRSRLEWP